MKRLFLHSWESRFDYAWEGRRWTFSAKSELPEEFERALFSTSGP
jgi:hypothetical protein